jgi:hypothetical protein
MIEAYLLIGSWYPTPVQVLQYHITVYLCFPVTVYLFNRYIIPPFFGQLVSIFRIFHAFFRKEDKMTQIIRQVGDGRRVEINQGG